MGELIRGDVAAEVAAEFPGLEVVSTDVALRSAKTPLGLAAELAAAADRIDGAGAAHASIGTVPAATRALLRQLGMDPERVPCTVDAVIRRRLMEGGFRPSGVVTDALTLTVLELGIPLVALDASAVEGPVGIARAASGSARWSEGDLILEDQAQPVARLFAEPFPEFLPDRRTTTVRIVAIAVPGVEPEFAELALQRAQDLLEAS